MVTFQVSLRLTRMKPRSQRRPEERRKCEGCLADIGIGSERCGWCGAPVLPSVAHKTQSLCGTPMIDQEVLYRDDMRSAAEAIVAATRSQAPAVVQAGGGQPSDKPSRTTGTPSSTK